MAEQFDATQVDPPTDQQLLDACKSGDESLLVSLLKRLPDKAMMALTVQKRQYTALEQAVKWIVVALSHSRLKEENEFTKFLGLVSRYKLVKTQLEGWATLFVKSKKIFSQVRDIRCQPAIGEEESKGETRAFDAGEDPQHCEIKTSHSEVGQAVADNEGKIRNHTEKRYW